MTAEAAIERRIRRVVEEGLDEQDADLLRDVFAEEGPMAGLHAEPTGEQVEYFGVYLARFDDGESVEWINHPERLSVFQQSGIVPDWDELLE